jgi:hypothetical protein
MIIELTDGYYIEIDEYNHTLKRKYVGKDKDGVDKIQEKVYGFYNNLGGAVEGFIKHNQLAKSPYKVTSLREYVKNIEEINKIAVSDIIACLKGGTK